MDTNNAPTPSTSDPSPWATSPAVEDAQALAFWLGPLHCVIVWRDGPQHLRSDCGAKRVRDIRPGDEVYWRGEPRTVRSVAVYR